MIFPALAHLAGRQRREVQHLRHELVILPRAESAAVRRCPVQSIAAIRRYDLWHLSGKGVLIDEIHAASKLDPLQAAQRAGTEAYHGVAVQDFGDAQRLRLPRIARHDRITVCVAQGIAPGTQLQLLPELGCGQGKGVRIRPRFSLSLSGTQEVPVQFSLRHKAEKHGNQEYDRYRAKEPFIHG